MSSKTRQTVPRCKSPAEPPHPNPDPDEEMSPDVVEILNSAVFKASENLKTLENLHQTLAAGSQAQLKKERNRIIKEIDDCMEKAISVLYKRRRALVSELSCLEEIFSTGRRECQRVRVRQKELHTAILKARHVCQVPLLETYCQVDEILEVLQRPVDVDSYDMSCLSLRSDLRCVLNVDQLKNSLELIDGNFNTVEKDAAVAPSSEQVKGGVKGGGSGAQLPVSSPRPKSPQKNSGAPNPDVIIEEIIEETVEYQEKVPAIDPSGRDPKPPERRRVQKKNRTALQDRIPVSQSASKRWVAVTHIINPTHFYVHYAMERKARVTLARSLHNICSGESSRFTQNHQIKSGALVFVKWKDGVWYRALVDQVVQKGCLEAVTRCSAADVSHLVVFLPDHGFSKELTIPGDGLDGLNECVRRAGSTDQVDLKQWAPQAVRCSLKDIVPSDLVKGWSREACEEMKHVIGSSLLEMQVLGDERDTLLVDLKKVSISHSVSLREHLVFMELARFYSPQVAPAGMKTLQFYPPAFPKLNTRLNAVVSHINTPSDFYIQLVDHMEFPLLNTKLQNFYGPPGAESDLQIYVPVLSQACVALYNNKDWCRARVTGFPEGQKVEVQYVDFGNRETVCVKDLRQIKDEFISLPAMALWCSLDGILSVGETWSEESIDMFHKITQQKLLAVVSKRLGSGSVALPVCLFEVSERSTELLSSIGEILLTEGLAARRTPVSTEETPPLEHTVWDPPLVEETSSPCSEPPLANLEASAIRPGLAPPDRLKDVKVKVTHVTSPENICVQLLQHDPQLNRIHTLLNEEYLKSEPQEMVWKEEMSCAANVNGVWERGKVCSVTSSSVAEVLRCDFGDKLQMDVTDLRPLPPELEGSYLLECCLTGIRPAGGCSTWTATACDFISSFLAGAVALMTVKEGSSRPVPVSLFCSDGAGHQVSVADCLIAEGLALRERSVGPASRPRSDASDVRLSAALGGPATLEHAARESVHRDNFPARSHTSSPNPAPRTAPPPERVRTQAYLPPESPPHGETSMIVTAVSDDGVIHTITLESVCELERLQDQLQQHIKTLPRQRRYNWRNVIGCVVMGSDMLLYRGEVQDVIGSYLKVRYVDQGTVENIPVCHVYPMVLCENVPQLSVPCQLNGILPVGGTWPWDAVALMKELLIGRSVSVHIIKLPEDPRGLITVQITLDGMQLSKIMKHHHQASFSLPGDSLEDCVVKPPGPDLDHWDLNTADLEEPQTVSGVYTDLQLPDEGKSFSVRVKHLRTPNEVFLSVLDSPVCDEDQESLDEALDRINLEIHSLPLLVDFPIDGPCLAKYSDGKFYRAKLLGFSRLKPSIQLLVRYVDFGSDDILPLCRLRRLPAALLGFPCQAARVRLAGFKAPRRCGETERIPYSPEWSMRAVLEMMDLLHGRLRAVVTGVEPQLAVLLYNDDGTLVHVPLVDKGLADDDDEPDCRTP